MTNPGYTPRIGDSERFRKTMTVAEQALFTGISGNLGGLYVDRTKAERAGLPDMAVFELAGASLASTCLARIAGPGYRIARFAIAFERALHDATPSRLKRPVAATLPRSEQEILEALAAADDRVAPFVRPGGRAPASNEPIPLDLKRPEIVLLRERVGATQSLDTAGLQATRLRAA